MRKGLKVKYSVVLNRLQNLINYIPSQAELCNICRTKQSTMSNRANRDSDIPSDEIVMINNYYGINLYAEEVLSNNNSITLDYYPDVFGSCGTGYFVSSEQKEQIQVPINALFKSLSKGKKYSVINAKGNSMSPYIESGDRLIIEHLDNQPIIDNHVYIFCYDNDLYIKRLYKNIDEIIAKSDNPDPIFKVKSIPKSQWNNLQLIGEIVGLMRELK